MSKRSVKSQELAFRKELRRDLVETFFKLRKENPSVSIQEIFVLLSKSKAPRFYVSFENARNHVSRHENKKPIVYEIRPNNAKLFKELHKRWKQALKFHPTDRYKYKILNTIILQEAPSFYLSIDAIRTLVYKELREK